MEQGIGNDPRWFHWRWRGGKNIPHPFILITKQIPQVIFQIQLGESGDGYALETKPPAKKRGEDTMKYIESDPKMLLFRRIRVGTTSWFEKSQFLFLLTPDREKTKG